MKSSTRYVLVVALLAALVPSTFGQILVYTATLTGPNEAPPNASPGTGLATITIDTSLNTMRVEATFSGLTGTTTAAHIHAGTVTPFTGTAGVATITPSFTGFPLGVNSGAMDDTYDLTLTSSYNASFITANGGTAVSAQAALLAFIANGQSYFNVHSSTFPAGEIRGFLVAVPEPSTYALLGGLGALGLVAWRRRRG